MTARDALMILSLLATPAGAAPGSPCSDEPEWRYEHLLPTLRDGAAFNIIVLQGTEVDQLCGEGAGGCAMKSAAEPPEPWLVVLRRLPRDFNDREGLCILGHEIFHALGARHETVRGEPPARSHLFD